MRDSVKRFLQCAAWVMLLWSGTVKADQIVQTRQYSQGLNSVVVPINLAFDQFDPGAGTLLAVEFVFEIEVRAVSIDVENRGPAPVVGHVEIGKVINYLGPGLSTPVPVGGDVALFDSVNLFRDFVSFAAFDGNFDFTGPDTFAFRQASPVVSTLTAAPTSLTPYIGTGAVPLEVIGILGVGVGGVPNSRVRFNNEELNGVVTLRYDFAPTAVPEPGTLSLIGIGLLAGLGLNSRRR